MHSGRQLLVRPCRGRSQCFISGECLTQVRFGFPRNGNNNNDGRIPIRSGNNKRCFHPPVPASHQPASEERSRRGIRGIHQREGIHQRVRRNNNNDGNRFCSSDARRGAPPSDDGADLLSRATRVLLPTLGQNGTLVIRSDSRSIAEVRIISQWRDDSLLELLPIEDDDEGDEGDEGDSEIAIFDGDDDDAGSRDAGSRDSSTRTIGRLRLKSHGDGVTTSLGRKGAMIEVDVSNSDHPARIVATVPEKSNITCRIAVGDVVVVGKLEGDVHLATSDGNITASKLRGHNVTLDTTPNAVHGAVHGAGTASPCVVHVKKAVEARTVRISSPSRVRAVMLNGSDVSIRVVANPSGARATGPPPTRGADSAGGRFDRLDDDDEGALIDVGSVYVSNGGGAEGGPDNEARLFVDDSNAIGGDDDDARREGLVRVKSSHGHLSVHAATDRRTPSPSPLVDLGGVNGSCDVALEAPPSRGPRGDGGAAARVHFDSMAPESISTITARGGAGRAGVTMDRKAKADVRLLSAGLDPAARLPSHVDAHSLTSDEAGDVRSALLDASEHVRESRRGGADDEDDGGGRSITIDTDAYRGEWGLAALDAGDGADDQFSLNGVEYAQGEMKNRSGEPDSRADARSRGGKIDIDGAALQALNGFHGRGEEGDSSPPMPLLAVASDGEIELETLSWFGSIARRYGLNEEEEEKEKDDRGLGRTATRSPRL